MMAFKQKEEGSTQDLPTDRAFVLQFRKLTDLKKDRFVGRIEHITSGEAALFQSLDDLVRFLDSVLSSGQSGSRGKGSEGKGAEHDR